MGSVVTDGGGERTTGLLVDLFIDPFCDIKNKEEVIERVHVFLRGSKLTPLNSSYNKSE